MDYQTYKNNKEYFEHCLDLLTNDNGFCQQLLQTTTYDEFLLKLHTYLQDNQTNPNPECINTCLELAMRIDKPLFMYKPRIDLELKAINGFTKFAVVALWLIENTKSKITSRPFGGWWHWFKHQLSKKQQPHSHKPPTVTLESPVSPETALIKKVFNRLGEHCWRQHIDWEDQELGPNVYDEGTHGGDVEPGYIESALHAHDLAGRMLGLPLGSDEYEFLFLAGRRHIQKGIRYDTTPRNLWRLKHLLEADVLADIDSSQVRYIPHYHWEVMAFNYFYKKHTGNFRQTNRPITEYLNSKYGDDIKITKKLLDNEFMRYQICFFDEYHTDSEIKMAIGNKLAAFYRKMQDLDFNLQKGQTGMGNEDAGLQEITKLVRWLEILHPFRGGNTRHNIILLNKLLVEAGFCPTILANRNDAPYRSVRGWNDQIITGMLRWQIIYGLIRVGLFFHLMQIRPSHYIYHRR
jgi:hypothetical protein